MKCSDSSGRTAREDDHHPDDPGSRAPDARPRAGGRARLPHRSVAVRSRIGYLPAEMPLYREMTGRGYLDFLAALQAPVDRAWLQRLLDRFDVSGVDLGRRLGELSHGMKRKFGIVQALMGRPPLLILDEPTSGLDPLMIAAFAETMQELKAGGDTTIFLSSHVLSEIERLCDRVAIIRKGRLVEQTSIAELRHRRRAACASSSTARRPSPRLRSRPPCAGAKRIAGTSSGMARSAAPSTRSAALAWWTSRSSRSRSRTTSCVSIPAMVPRGEDARRADRTIPPASCRTDRAVATVLSLFQILTVVMAVNLQREGLFSQFAALIPPIIQEVLGGAEASTFRGTLTLGFFHPVIMLALSCTAIFIASEPAGEVEDGLVDIVAARPVPRHLLVTRSAIVSGAASAAMVAAMFVANRAALALMLPAGSPAPGARELFVVGLNLVAVVWCFGAAGLLAGVVASRRAAAQDRWRWRSSWVTCPVRRRRLGARASVRADLAVSLLRSHPHADRRARPPPGFHRPPDRDRRPARVRLHPLRAPRLVRHRFGARGSGLGTGDSGIRNQVRRVGVFYLTYSPEPRAPDPAFPSPEPPAPSPGVRASAFHAEGQVHQRALALDEQHGGGAGLERGRRGLQLVTARDRLPVHRVDRRRRPRACPAANTASPA